MKIKFNSDEFSLKKALQLYDVTVFVRSVLNARTNEKTSGWFEKLRGLSHYKKNIFKIKSRHTDKNVY